MIFSDALLQWFDANRREMPWREEPSPYRVWVSEIMLQQTRVSAVIPYFMRFIEQLPDVYALAAAKEDTLLLLWQGLGYYSRASNLQKAAAIIVEEHRGVIPSDYETLLTLPGIGPYTAGAVASIAFGEKVAAVDGNVLRVFTRVLEWYEDIQKTQTKRRIKEEAEARMPEDRPGDFNQSLMELGAMICLPQNPLCGKCPVREFCKARRNGTQRELPVKTGKKPVQEEKRTVFLLTAKNTLAIRKREATGLLKNMWEFLHTQGHLKEEEACLWLKNQGMQPVHMEKGPSYTHIFSHRAWNMISYVVEVERKEEENVWIVADELRNYAIPSAFSFLLRAYWDGE
ncbi:MAG: A/G-specific adenine glycosylase [Peptoniphilaceae bacterium]|nr:A/G-specific adenine glycosylase [Bacillota bacterium]